jgi:hypothetical protein
MKRIPIFFATAILTLLSLQSCKKCYTCTCTSPFDDPAFGCTKEGSEIELCERNSVTGRILLDSRVMIKESEGYSCTLK